MSKRVLLILGLLAVLLLSGAALAQDDVLPDLGGQEITVAVENAYPPFNLLDEDGNGVGWDYDAVNEICARINCVPVYVETAWDGMILAVSNGEFDVAGDGITITEERDQVIDFSIGYMSTDQTLMVQLGDARYPTVEDFIADEEALLGTQVGTTNYETAVGLLDEARIVAYDTFGVAVQALIDGQVDAVIIDNTAGQGYTGVNADQVQLIDDVIQSDLLGFAFPEGSELSTAFNAALESMIADRTLEIINAKWFPQQLPNLQGQEITVAVENAYPPFNLLDEDGNGVGWDYDAVNEICARINCVPVYVETAWDGMILAVSNGEFDVAGDGITITEERDQVIDFSIGYMSTDQTLMVQLGDARYPTVEDFIADEEALLGTQVGTTNYETAVGLLDEARIVAYDTFGVAVQALIDGQVDAVIIDNTAGQGYTGVNADQVQLIDDVIQSDLLGFAFPEGSALVDAFNKAIISMVNDGTLVAINATWFPPAGAE